MNYYNRKGEPVTLEEFSRLFSDAETNQRMVGNTTIVKPDLTTFMVSTVHLGVDHGFGLNERQPPILFETMVFDVAAASSTEYEGWTARYATESEAIKGHRYTVQELLQETKGTVIKNEENVWIDPPVIEEDFE